jgi:hypothetical protein
MIETRSGRPAADLRGVHLVANRLSLTAAVLMLGTAFPAAAMQGPASTTRKPSAAQIEDSLMSVVGDDAGDREVEQSLRKGAHLIATRDLSELTDVIKEAERTMKEAFKGVKPADLQALKNLSSGANR